MNANKFVDALADIKLPNVFNPYSDHCNLYDIKNAATVRKKNLSSYLKAVQDLAVDTIWMGRDLGYRGGRRTGLALTDEFHLQHFSECYPGSNPKRATRGALVTERTATEIWSAITELDRPPLLWNVFPLHPHKEDDELSNRRFTAKELKIVDSLNRELASSLKIRRVVCIGQDAVNYASSLNIELHCIRHPSYGGINEFRSGIERLYGLTLQKRPHKQKDLF